MLYDPEEFEVSLLITDDRPLRVPVTAPQRTDLSEEWERLLVREGWLGALQPSDHASGQLLTFFNGYRVRVYQEAQDFSVALLRPQIEQQLPRVEHLSAWQLTQLLRYIEALPAPSLDALGVF